MWGNPIVFLGLFVPNPAGRNQICLHRQHQQYRLLPRTETMAMAATKRMIGKLSPKTSAMLLCDVQDRFRPVIHNSETVISNSRLLTSACKLLDVPVVITEQYPKAFGNTVKDCFADPTDLEKYPTFPKTLFSMMTPEVSAHLESLNKTSFLITGLETHVCVQQTVLDLLELGHDVHVIVDACSSQQPFDREIALQRMANAGAYLTTAQSAIFMLMQSAKHPNFKQVSKLVVEHMKLPNEFNDAMLASIQNDVKRSKTDSK